MVQRGGVAEAEGKTCAHIFPSSYQSARTRTTKTRNINARRHATIIVMHISNSALSGSKDGQDLKASSCRISSLYIHDLVPIDVLFYITTP